VERLDPRLDIVFKMLFGAPDSRDQLTSLISAVLRPARPITDVQVLNPEVRKEDVTSKGIALDVLVQLDGGMRVDVEMQTYRAPAFRERALYYWSRLHAAQLGIGERYEALHPTVSVLFMGYAELPGERLHSTFRLSEIHDGTVFSPGIELHMVELPKRALLDEQARRAEAELVAWTTFLDAETPEELEAAMKSHPEIARAEAKLQTMSRSEKARLMAMLRERNLAGQRIHLGAARSEGRAEGLAEGRAEGHAEGEALGLAKGEALGLAKGRAETLIELLTVRFGPIDARTAARIRAAGQAKHQRWLSRVFEAPTLAALLDDRRRAR
jgi:predicted transposase/invertase (TIGR01784 family)